jgi:hypothetical protein
LVVKQIRQTNPALKGDRPNNRRIEVDLGLHRLDVCEASQVLQPTFRRLIRKWGIF